MVNFCIHSFHQKVIQGGTTVYNGLKAYFTASVLQGRSSSRKPITVPEEHTYTNYSFYDEKPEIL